MAGSLRQRRDRGADAWEFRVYLGRDPVGRVRQRSVLFRGSKRAAERELPALSQSRIGPPPWFPTRRPDRWVRPPPSTTPSKAGRPTGGRTCPHTTVRRYEGIWRVHVRNSNGRRRLVSLGPYDVERYFRALKDAGLSEASVRQTRAMLHRACRLARKWSSNTLPNPVTNTELPGC